MPRSRPPNRAFSLIELVIVVVIIGIIAAIALPRLGNAAQNSQASAIKGSLKVLTSASEVYAAEHDGLLPSSAADGSVDASVSNMIARLTGKTSVDGSTTGGTLPFGPYVRSIPKNPISGLDTIRIDGAPAGAGTEGWRFDTVLHIFQADDSLASAAILPDGPTP